METHYHTQIQYYTLAFQFVPPVMKAKMMPWLRFYLLLSSLMNLFYFISLLFKYHFAFFFSVFRLHQITQCTIISTFYYSIMVQIVPVNSKSKNDTNMNFCCADISRSRRTFGSLCPPDHLIQWWLFIYLYNTLLH